MDALTALRLQLEWGADEALAEKPIDRLRPQPAPPRNEIPRPLPATPAPTPVGKAGLVAHAQHLAAAAATLPELRAALAAFDGGGLAATATNLVFADGNPAASLMLVGEGPGNEEDRAGRPFVGPSGQLLDRMLASIGLDRSQCLITNLIPWRPPGNRNPTDAEILLCLPFLLRHIALMNPRRLVTLGAIATQSLTASTAGIRKTRGKWTSIDIPGLERPIPTLPMLHPAYLLRTPGAKRDAWADWCLLRHALDRDPTQP